MEAQRSKVLNNCKMIIPFHPKSALIQTTIVLFLCTFLDSARAQDLTNLGGATTSIFTDRNALQLTTPNVTSELRRQEQLDGFTTFHRRVPKSQGLGPVFNTASCGDCHLNNGRGRDRFNLPLGSPMLIKVAERRKLNPDGSPINVKKVGEQIRDHSNSKKHAFDYNIRLRYRTIEGFYPDGTKYKLRKPILSFVLPDGRTHRKVGFSLRMTPPIIGPGLLEAIPEETILGFAQENASRLDSIRGTPQYVKNKRTGLTELGRFGFKASHPTLEQQNAAASFFDMGVSNSIFHDRPDRIELPEEFLHLITIYLAIGGVPPATDQSDSSVMRGKQLFQEINCSGCHRFNITTAADAQHPELQNQLIHPFTDLLLHDMGPGLADRRPEHNATRKMWRTTPLYGIGKGPQIMDEENPERGRQLQRYLHDGRARTLEEAILWHSGEAKESKDAFMNLTKDDRQHLIRFLQSL